MELHEALDALPRQRDADAPGNDVAVNLFALARDAAWLRDAAAAWTGVRYVAFAGGTGGVDAAWLDKAGIRHGPLEGIDPALPTVLYVKPGDVNLNAITLAASAFAKRFGPGLHLSFQGSANPLIAKPAAKQVEQAMAEFAWLYRTLVDETSRAALAGLVKARQTGDAGYLALSGYPHYFHPEVPLPCGGVVIDAGVSGTELDSTFQLSDAAGPDGLVVSLEPEPDEFALAKEKLAGRANISLRNYGVADKRCTVQFVKRGPSSYSYQNQPWFKRFRRRIKAVFKRPAREKSFSVCELRTIDDICAELGRPAAAIKMDVEGAEMSALRGSEAVLRRDRPDLYISLYHKFDDLYEIPHYIESLQLGYAFYLGQHSILPWETVLYATAHQNRSENLNP